MSGGRAIETSIQRDCNQPGDDVKDSINKM